MLALEAHRRCSRFVTLTPFALSTSKPMSASNQRTDGLNKMVDGVLRIYACPAGRVEASLMSLNGADPVLPDVRLDW